MKALGVILIMVVLVAVGCGDSTNDVRVARETIFVPPDTVVTKDELVMEFYLAENPRSMENETSLDDNQRVQLELARLTAAGCIRDESGSTLIRVTDPEGRRLEATWFAFLDPSDASGTTGVVHVHGDGNEYVIPLRVPSEAGSAAAPAEEFWTKSHGGEWGPSLNLRTLFNNCASFIVGLYQVCVGQCAIGGTPLKACQNACAIAVAAAYVACIFFSIVG
jgi:hypothetical protein